MCMQVSRHSFGDQLGHGLSVCKSIRLGKEVAHLIEADRVSIAIMLIFNFLPTTSSSWLETGSPSRNVGQGDLQNPMNSAGIIRP